MSNADRIEELRAKYEENPRRYFAPLANEYRKAGDLAQAIAICREHLPKQPGHMSGFIVYGQTLFEANNLEEARSVFEQALALDPENLIALKHLGDIARMNGENGVARRWYARVLDADPRNDDIASQLASLGAPTPITPILAIPEPPAYSESATLGEAVGVFATFDPSSLLDVPEDVAGIAGGRDFWAPTEQRPVAQHEPLDLDFPESPEPVAEEEEAFEEGLLAPEWPDTSELVARVSTPFRSATPISVPATPDTVAAFGRETFDAVETTAVDAAPSDELVDAFLPPEPVARAVETTPVDAVPSDELVDAFLPPEPVARAIEPYEPVEFADSDFAPANHDGRDVVTAFATPLSTEVVADAGLVTSDVITVDVVRPERDDDADAPVSSAAMPEPQESAYVPAAESAVESTAEPAFEMVDEVAADVMAPAAEEAGDDQSAAVDQTVDTFSEFGASTESAITETWADEDLVWADSVATNSDTSEIEYAEPSLAETESWAPEAELPLPATANSAASHERAFAEALPWEQEPGAELEALAYSETAEFEIPQQLQSGAHAALVEPHESLHQPMHEPAAEAHQPIADAFAEVDVPLAATAFDIEALTAPAIYEAIEETAVHASTSSVAEESFAEVASQIESEKGAPFVTETMAELLVAQGFLVRAIEVYDELVRRRPHDPVLVARLQELRALHEAEELPAFEASATELDARDSVTGEATPPFNTPIRNTPLYMTPQYNTPQHNTPQHNTPQHNTAQHNTPVYNTAQHNTPAAHSTPHFGTPVSATPALVPSFGASDATLSNASERHANDRLQAFRTARERFAELSRRRVARRTPTHATVVADDATEGLSSLFGTAVPTTTDELAARALADAFGPVQDSGESLFDPAPTPTPSMPMRSLTPRSTTPVYTPATSDSRSVSDRQPAADYSFDRFFPDPAMAGREGQSVQATSTASGSSQPVNEDLAQFSAWLKGLNNA